MSWFSRRKPKVDVGPAELQSGVYRSPAMSRLGQELKRRRPSSILDLGASSTENVSYFSEYTTNLCIQDLFHGACDDSGKRSTAFRFGGIDSLEMPAEGERFDVMLMWDLLHYVEPEEQRRFVARLASHCQPDAILFLIGASSGKMPLMPIQFKIESDDSLFYTVPEGGRTTTVGLTTRQVEGLMVDFQPMRCFQLRNGLQEFIFRYRGSTESASEGNAAEPVAV